MVHDFDKEVEDSKFSKYTIINLSIHYRFF